MLIYTSAKHNMTGNTPQKGPIYLTGSCSATVANTQDSHLQNTQLAREYKQKMPQCQTLNTTGVKHYHPTILAEHLHLLPN